MNNADYGELIELVTDRIQVIRKQTPLDERKVVYFIELRRQLFEAQATGEETVEEYALRYRAGRRQDEEV